MARWINKYVIPKGVKCKRSDWVRYDNQSLQAGLLVGWRQEECYLMLTARGDKPLIMALQGDEAAAICRVLSTALMNLVSGEADV